MVLENVRASLRIDWRGLVSEVRDLGDVDLSTFLREAGVELEDIYRRRRGGWASLRRQAGFDDREPGPDDERLAGAIGRMLHIDDLERLRFIGQLLDSPAERQFHGLETREGRLLAMLHFVLWGAGERLARVQDLLRRLADNPARRDELRELVPMLIERIRRVTHPVDPLGRVPLHVHGRYSRDEALGAFGVPNPSAMRQGVWYVREEHAHLLFVTLRKTEDHFSPTTMYNDRAITPSLFQWESQSATSEASPTGRRYVHHQEDGSTVHLFVRESKESDGDLGAPPYLYAGRARYVRHSGDRPMRITWKLDQDLPADAYLAARVAAG